MIKRRRIPLVCAVALGVAASVAIVAPASARPATSFRHGTAALPTEIVLPPGFQPEGIAIGTWPFAYFGSRADGDLYRANLITGQGSVFSQGPGTGSLGMKVDPRGRLFVAGGGAGDARVVSAVSGAVLASYQFATAPTFVNDVVLTGDAAWFTDSQRAVLYRVPLGHHGELPVQAAVVSVPLTGDFVLQAGFNANGIARTPDGRALLIVQSNTGLLFRVNQATGVATTVDLGGALLTSGDGILLSGHTLFVVRNQANLVAVVRLNAAGTAGSVVAPLTDPRLDVPTSAATFGDRLYLTNARFSTPPTPTTPYSAIAITRP